MQSKPEGWDSLFSKPHRVQYRFVIAGVEYLAGDIQTPPVIEKPLMREPTIGRCCTGTLNITVRPKGEIPKAAPIQAFCRLVPRNGGDATEWVPQGRFFVSKRKGNSELITLTCRDAMAKAGQPYQKKSAIEEWPAPMSAVLEEIAALIGVELDARNSLKAGAGYVIEYPAEDLLISEVLGFIAAANGGNFVMTESGKLRLVPFPGTSEPAGGKYAHTSYKPLSTGEKTVTGVTLVNAEEAFFSVGDTSGVELTATIPNATQAMADDLRGLIGQMFIPYEATGVYADPCIEVGDTYTVTRNGKLVPLVSGEIKANCNSSFTCAIACGVQEDDEDEFPYKTASQLQAQRAVSTSKSYFGNRINRSEGFVSEFMQDGEAQARMVANATQFSMQKKTETGWIDCIYFDPIEGKYRIAGDVLVTGMLTAEDLSTEGKTVINGSNITTGEINAQLVKILGSINFQWSGENIVAANPEDANQQIRFGLYDGQNMGIGWTRDGGKTWQNALGFNGLNINFSEAITQAVEQANAATDEKLQKYTTTEAMSSALEQTAEGFRQTVESSVTEVKQYATDAATSAKDAANEATDEKLKSYSTTEQMNSVLEQTAEGFRQTVEKSVTATKEYADSVASSAEDAANAATDEKLQKYTTTEAMSSALEQTAENYTAIFNRIGLAGSQTGIVKADIDGIKVTHSQIGGYTQMSADGFRIFNNNGIIVGGTYLLDGAVASVANMIYNPIANTHFKAEIGTVQNVNGYAVGFGVYYDGFLGGVLGVSERKYYSDVNDWSVPGIALESGTSISLNTYNSASGNTSDIYMSGDILIDTTGDLFLSNGRRTVELDELINGGGGLGGLKILTGTAQVASNHSHYVDLQPGFFSSTPTIIATYATNEPNDGGDWGSIKISVKSTTSFILWAGGNEPTTPRDVDWVAIGR